MLAFDERLLSSIDSKSFAIVFSCAFATRDARSNSMTRA
jgi:hypothetical protein